MRTRLQGMRCMTGASLVHSGGINLGSKARNLDTHDHGARQKT